MHFGNPLKEGRDFLAGTAAAVRDELATLQISGVDRLTWLHSITSQDLTSLKPGDSTETLLLSPQGKIEQQIAVLATADSLLLMVPRDRAELLLQFLQRMRFTLRVEIADVTAVNAVLELCLPVAAKSQLWEHEALRWLRSSCSAAELDALPVWYDPWSWVPAHGISYYAGGSHPTLENPGIVRVLLPRQQLSLLAAAVTSGDAKIAGSLATTAHEVALWRPTVAELDERALPHEFDLLRSSVHLNKGCYRGQETVAKVHNLGHPPRRLVFVHLDGSAGELPEAGDYLYAVATADEVVTAKPVGKLTRAVLHCDWGPIALALVKRSAPTSGAYLVQLRDGTTAAATVETIVDPAAGAVNALDPAVRKALLQVK